MTRSVQVFAYLRPSAIRNARDGKLLALETSGGSTAGGTRPHPSFFSGFLASPQAAAAGLLSVADVAAARYGQRLLGRSLDPVVSGNGDRLRFESFSGCRGVHARLDVLRAGLDGGQIGHGTTNVDVNVPLREALSRIGAGDPTRLRVGPDEPAVTPLGGPVLEKKVPLPDHWLRGFAETQVIASGFDLRAELTGADALGFLRSLPRGHARDSSPGAQWLTPAGRSLRPVTRPAPGAVCLPGPERLAALQRVLRHVTGLRVYGPPVAARAAPVASAWEVSMPGMRLTLMLSPETSRGFSGEGGALEALSTHEAAEDAELVSVLLAWEPRIDPAELAERAGLSVRRAQAALTRLATAGRVGYDTAEAAYFHRELPYDAERAERHTPRLRAARALLDTGAVTLDGEMASVASGDHAHRVRHASGPLSCTCPWWAQYRGGRGPCKHALAVRMLRRGAASERVGSAR
ncbi:SWIM zinc finger family protein [Streptomyces sp. H27-D2]|uniref:SWIM zinc finger family protein n=1 Tax=Streptomyces sp. H27-D2 TaxID=3046304 RepID=UPI002DBFFCCD|nr:SWIM zinc finger family protein [Streptomyces sp. H27-D2]MEC4020784.1 SWIM zinc finger family protein [Streptomyces sp. H27-D2]